MSFFTYFLKNWSKWHFHPYWWVKMKFHPPKVGENSEGVFADGPSKEHGKAWRQVPSPICNSYACRIWGAVAIWGGDFAPYEQNSPPEYLGNKSETAHLNCIISPTPLHNFGLQHQVRKPPPFQLIVYLWNCVFSFHSPVPCSTDGFTVCKPRLSSDAPSPDSGVPPRRGLASKSHHHDSAPKGQIHECGLRGSSRVSHPSSCCSSMDCHMDMLSVYAAADQSSLACDRSCWLVIPRQQVVNTSS